MIKVRHMAQVCREAMASHSGTAHWDELNDRQRRLSVGIVNFILVNPDATPESCHNAWMGEMRYTEGFDYGETTDEVLRTHRNLVPYEQLDAATQAAYALSIGVVRGLQAISHRYEATQGMGAPVTAPSLVSEGTTLDAGIPTQDLTPEDVAILTPAVPSDAQFMGVDPGQEIVAPDAVDRFVDRVLGRSDDEPVATDPATAE